MLYFALIATIVILYALGACLLYDERKRSGRYDKNYNPRHLVEILYIILWPLAVAISIVLTIKL